jgi:hypothetical protein
MIIRIQEKSIKEDSASGANLPLLAILNHGVAPRKSLKFREEFLHFIYATLPEQSTWKGKNTVCAHYLISLRVCSLRKFLSLVEHFVFVRGGACFDSARFL